jgi:hypothetical protein
MRFKSRTPGLAILLTFILSSFSVSAQALPSAKPIIVHQSTSISKAKSLIRSLYYGYQQAGNVSWANQKKYILSHNYPGMYSNGASCLNKYSSYGDTMPNLSTVSKESSWKLPAGIYLNKLAGKKPSGETFVFEATSGGKKQFNHVTILKGKAYFFLWICNASKPSTVDPTIKANRSYYSAAMALASEESDLLARYDAVSGVNYTSDLEMYNTVLDLIPDVQIFLNEIQNLPTPTGELFELNQVWYDGWSSYLSAFSTLRYAIETQNGSQVAQANQYLNQGRGYIVQFSKGFRNLKR